MDKLAETRGMDMVDRERAKHEAQKQEDIMELLARFNAAGIHFK